MQNTLKSRILQRITQQVASLLESKQVQRETLGSGAETVFLGDRTGFDFLSQEMRAQAAQAIGFKQ
jgi:hypothetical protein